MAFTAAVSVSVSVAVAVADIVLADTHGGDDALAFAHIDNAHAARGAPRDANAVHRTADQRSTIGHQHDLVAVPHRERRHDLAAPSHVHELDALAAAAGHAIFVGQVRLPKPDEAAVSTNSSLACSSAKRSADSVAAPAVSSAAGVVSSSPFSAAFSAWRAARDWRR